MATLTGTNLLDSIIDSTGIEPNALIYATLSAKLQQMIDNGTYSKLAASIAISAFSTQINAATEALDLADTIETNVALIEAAADDAAVDAIDFPDYGGVAPITYTLTYSADSVHEGEANTFTVTASAPVDADTTVTFQLVAGTATLADFNAGSFNPQTATILAGETTAEVSFTSITNDGTELAETYSVSASVGGESVGSVDVTLLDGSIGAGQTFTLTTGLDIIPGMNGSNGNTVTSGDDTIIGVIDTGTPANSTLNATDIIDAGEGINTLRVVAAGALTTAQIPVVDNIDTMTVSGSAAVTLDTTSQVGLTDLMLTKAGAAVSLTAAATTDVDVTMKAAGAAVDVIGGNNVNVALTDVAAAADVITIGATAPAGAVTVSTAGKALTASTVGATLSAINVTGGTTINVDQSATIDKTAAASDTTNITMVEGAVAIVGNASTTEVTVMQDATVTAANASYKTGGVTETASVKFSALTAGQTLIMGGLTFTAPAALTAQEAAASFANLIKGTLPAAGDSQGSGPASDGTYTGIMSGWTSSAVVGDTVVFTSTAPNSNPGDLANTGTGTVVITTTDGKAHDAGATDGVMGVTAGAVTVNDVSGTITTITLDGFGAASSTTNTSVLSTLNLSHANNVAIPGALTVADTAATLALNVEALGASAADAVLIFTAAPTTLNVVSTGTNYVNLTAAATETLNVSGTGLFDIDATDLAALKTVVVSGTAGLSLNPGVANTVTSINTAATTGTVTSTINGTVATYTGGAGVDKVSLDTGTSLTKAIDLGAGDDTLTFGALAVTASTAALAGGEGTDTLSMTTAVADGLDAGAQSFYTSFEHLTLSDAYGDVDANLDTLTLNLANLGFTSYVTTSGTVADGGNSDVLVLDKMASGGTVVLTANGLISVTNADFATPTTDVLNAVLSSTGDLAAGTLTAANVETINISTVDTEVATTPTKNVDSLTLTADKATSVMLSGADDLTLTMTGSTKVTAIDAHTMTGGLTVTSLNTTTATTITGGSGNDVLTAATGTTADILIGGAGDDTLTANAGLDTLTGGAGNDLFVIGTPSLNSSSYATITDFAAGDLIKMAGADSFAASKVVQADTAVFQDYANAAMNAIGVDDVAWFQYLGNTYIVMDKGTTDSVTFINGNDFVVKLTGLVDLTDATFNDTHDTIALA